MFKYSFKIDTNNGKGLVDLPIAPTQGFSDVRNLNEELDNGFMILYLKNSKSLPIMSYIEYKIIDTNNKSIEDVCHEVENIIKVKKKIHK